MAIAAPSNCRDCPRLTILELRVSRPGRDKVGAAMDVPGQPEEAPPPPGPAAPFSERLLVAMTQSAPAPIVVVDARGRIIRTNPSFLETFGFAEDEVIAHSMVELFGADSPLVAALALEGGPTSGSSVTGADVEHRGQRRPLLVTRFALADDTGALEAVGLILIDLAFRQRAARAIDEVESAQLERARAESANLAKSEFLSRMSHELRTPLNSIVGFTQLLARGDLDPADREFVDLIERAGRHLVQLINDVLDVAGIEAGKLTLSLEPVDVHEAVVQAIELVELTARAHQITIIRPEPAGPVWAKADWQRLTQILLNLLANAIRYNRVGGSVAVTTTVAGPHVRIAVSDTGSGIPAELLPRVFEPFERLGAEQSGIEGSGMGLPVSRGLAEHMGGRLTVVSEHNVGSTFTLELPGAVQRRDLEPAASSSPADQSDEVPLRVLYIEDNAANLRLMEHVLARNPATTLLSARTGQGGLSLLETERVDLAMVDLHLPDMDGTEVLRRIRATPSIADVTVAIVSADAMTDRIEQLRAQGADYYITKPLDLHELYATLDEVRHRLADPEPRSVR
jgi:PAS domain S-box-containing protein